MAIPTQIGGYERQPSGMFIKLADGTGPYSVDSSGMATLLGGAGGGGGNNYVEDGYVEDGYVD